MMKILQPITRYELATGEAGNLPDTACALGIPVLMPPHLEQSSKKMMKILQPITPYELATGEAGNLPDTARALGIPVHMPPHLEQAARTL